MIDKISKDRQYKTREGRPYRCYATDGGGAYPVHGAVFKGGEWWPVRHTEIGRFNEAETHGYDLIEVKPRMKFERWVVLHRNGEWASWMTRPSDASTVDAFAIKHIVFEVEEGEGLDAV